MSRCSVQSPDVQIGTSYNSYIKLYLSTLSVQNFNYMFHFIRHFMVEFNINKKKCSLLIVWKGDAYATKTKSPSFPPPLLIPAYGPDLTHKNLRLAWLGVYTTRKPHSCFGPKAFFSFSKAYRSYIKPLDTLFCKLNYKNYALFTK